MVREADDALVAKCRFLGSVDGTSGWGGLASEIGIANAKNEVREKAAKTGATDLVWGSSSGGFGSCATGRAYACGR